MAYKLATLILIVPAIVTFAVGVDFVLRGTGFGELKLPRSGLWAVAVGLCCLSTGWVAKEGLTSLWRKS